MHGDGVFFQAFVYLAAAVLSVPLAKRLGLGSVLGYLIAGAAIGPHVLGLVGAEGEDVMHFAEFGVVMMLFLIGLELEPRRLWRLRGPILGLGGLQVVVTALALAGIALAVGQPWRVALTIGLVLSLSSTAMVLQTLAEKQLMKTDAGQSSFSVLLFQDIAVIPMLALLPLLAAPGTGHGADGHDAAHAASALETWLAGLPPWGKTLVVLGAVALVIAAGRFLTRPLFRIIAGTHLRELFTATALLLVIGIALLMTAVGVSPALGTFLAGVVLAGSEYRHELEAEIEPFKGLLLGLFFISVGASVDFPLIAGAPGMVAGIVVGLVGVKLLILLALAWIFRMSLDQGLLFAFALAQGGEFAFVLISFALQNEILGVAVSAPLIAAVAVSMATTPLLLVLAERFVLPRLGTRESEQAADTIDEENAVIIAGFSGFGNTVGRLLRAQGVEATVLDHDSDRVDLVRSLGLKVFYGDATRVDLLHAAGADSARLLVAALDEPADNLRLVEAARKHFPQLEILCRARDRADAYDLLELGVDHVYREHLDTALRVGVDALRLLGRRAYQSTRAAHAFRCHDEDALLELARMRGDRRRYISVARERIRLLESSLRAETALDAEERDAGWDVESLQREFGGDQAV
ncbi:MAG: monovalent cation:proton antiporter-2 (CPA2) family protein [Acidobacteriota bacterium]